MLMPTEPISMRKLRYRQVAKGLSVSPSIVSHYACKSAELWITSWPLDDKWDDHSLQQALFKTKPRLKGFTIAHMMFDEIHSDDSPNDSFAEFIAAWPSNDMIGLWDYLKKKGQRLGGNTGPYALRAIGKDTFLLTRDIEAYFRANKIIDGGLQSKKSLATFNQWQSECGLSLSQLSRLVAYATGDNNVQVEFD
ncbi:MAG: hypothetical protein ACJA0H_000140 [Francisellaceae bacterium]|jgi:hypothetical protein